MVAVLGPLALLGGGVTAGVLFCVALSIVPAFRALPPDRYVELHRLIGRRYDPVMPVTVLSTTLLDLVLAAVAELPLQRLLFAVGAVLTLGVSAVSHLANVPINRVVKGIGPGGPPADWRDPRRRWRNWNLLRTGLALAALLVSATALAAG